MMQTKQTKGYLIPEVAGELVADVAKTIASSPRPLSQSEVVKCFEGQYTPEYISRAILAGLQIKILSQTAEKGYVASEESRDDLKRANRKELSVPFRKHLQDFSPFLLYIDFVSKGYPSIEAARKTGGIFSISAAPEKINTTLRGWGTYSGLVSYNRQTGNITINIETEKLLTQYVKKLLDALEAELRAKVFAIDMLGSNVFAYFDQKGLSLNDFATALRNYEADPKPSAGRALETFEAFVYAIADDKGIPVQKPKTLSEWCDGLRAKREIPSNQLLLCHGLIGARNMTHHNPDAETGQPWIISRQAALTFILLSIVAIRSVYMYVDNRTQEV